MPRNAQRDIDVDYVRKATEMGELLCRLAREPAGPFLAVPRIFA